MDALRCPDPDQSVKVLSGGEKTRLAMIRLLLEPVNFLILDEPTNHLDIPTKEILKQAVKDFTGTVIVVSHDRQFLDGLVDKVYEFGGGKVRECLGGIYEFLEKKKLSSLNALNSSAPSRVAEPEKKPVVAKAEPQPQAQESKTRSYAEQREHDKAVRRARKKVEEAEAEVASREAAVKAIEDELASGSPTPDVYDRHAAAVKALENAMSVWELASLDLDALTN